MKHITSLILFTISLNTFSQTRDINTIVSIGDSVLNSTIGKTYKEYYHLDSSSIVDYYTIFNTRKEHKLFDSRKIRKRYSRISLIYKLIYPELKELKSNLYIVMDRKLKLEINTNEVPEFILENTECNFINKDKAVEIGKKSLKEKGIRIEYSLNKNFITKEFTWEINNIIKECTDNGFMDGTMERILINPLTGELIEQDVVDFGHVF